MSGKVRAPIGIAGLKAASTFNPKNNVASPTPGTSTDSLWLLRSRPDQVHEC
jgi:hypothetical protein